MFRFLFFLCFSLANIGISQAQSSGFDDFVMGGTNVAGVQFSGVHWKIPNAYISAPYYALSPPPFFILRMELPSLSPLKASEHNAGNLSDQGVPILSATVNYDPDAVVGQALLDRFMSKAITDCSTCVANTSIGGKGFTDYPTGSLPTNPGTDTSNTPFNLYVNTTPNGNFFFVCYYELSGKPVHCEVKEKLDNGLILTYWFPQEEVSRIFSIDAKLRVLLASFQVPEPTISPAVLEQSTERQPCWSPQPNTDDAETIPLKIGPDTWQIPRAYAATFGSNQTQDQQVNGFQLFLKLPDLEPISANDPSPIEIHGHGNYVSIFFSYDNRFGAVSGIKPVIGPDGHLVAQFERYIGPNNFINYEELGNNGLPANSIYWSTGGISLISNDPTASSNSFPPQYFTCGAFFPGLNAGCQLDVLRAPKSTSVGHYLISYDFSRDYFSQINSISICVEKLYNTFSGS